MSAFKLKMKVSTKIAGMCLCLILTFCLAFAWLYAQSSQRQYKDRRLKVQNQVESAYGVLEYFAAEASQGRLPREEAQTQAKNVIKGLRYGDDDYFWINDTQPVMIMHPFKPQLDGKDLSQAADPNGKKLFVEFVEVCKKEGGGFVDYFWPMPGHDEPVAKISYVKLFPQWDWIIGNGLYVDDVAESLWHVLKTTLILVGMVMVVTILLVVALSRSITKPLRLLQDGLKELALGHIDIAVPVGVPVNCSEKKGCGQKGCPSYGKVDPCWVTAGSFSVDKQCPRAQKGEDCKSCNLYGVRNEMEELGSSLMGLAKAMKMRSDLALQIANGDLTKVIPVSSEKDTLGQALSKMHGNLSSVLCQVQATAQQIGTDANQISAGSADLADGATRQAAALEEISSSMHEIASQTGHNAENAKQANLLATQGRGAADKGNEEMEGMMAAMGEISVAAVNISKIIKVIDEIAFQTNLLALNAAVEAARAGQHGKGFAVVAEEVRNLAARSAKAAKETEELIASSVTKTERGTVIAGRTAEALKEIVDVSTKVSDLVGEIALASNEQAMGINQINTGLSQIDQVNQQTTASTEESAASAAVLANHAQQLQALLRQFKLDSSRCKAAPPNSRSSAAMSSKPKLVAVKPAMPRKALAAPVSKGEQWSDFDDRSHSAAPIIALDDDEFGKY
jgi:methyl-accepting chemotaxis protein